jgi:hypothetical protein
MRYHLIIAEVMEGNVLRRSMWIYCLVSIGIIIFIGKLYNIGGIGFSPRDGQQATINDVGLVAISKT